MSSNLPNYDATFCGKQPLHQTNLIQPHGVLIVVSVSDFSIIQVSENIHELISVSFLNIIDQPLASVLHRESFADILHKTNHAAFKRKMVMPVTFLKGDRLVEYYTSIHEVDETLLLEIEFKDELAENAATAELFQQVTQLISALEEAFTLEDICTIAARGIKKISGYDKVMLYSFDEEWNGTVLAQEMEAGMDDYLGLKFPASDIPKPARDLYFKNPVRVIPNRSYVPVPLYPVINPVTGTLTNLSNSKLRNVVNVHLEYMKSMNITASMSVRIKHHDKLWGLISVHHRTAKYLSSYEASVFELLSTVLSAQITAIISRKGDELRAERQRQCTTLMHKVRLYNSIPTALGTSPELLLNFLNADGFIISWDGTLIKAGLIPEDDQIEQLITWLKKKSSSATLHLSDLPLAFKNAAAWANTACGIVSLPIEVEAGNFIIGFRGEKVRNVKWAGNPHEAITFEAGSTAYHPRNSFQVWKQTVRNSSQPWSPEEIEIIEKLRNSFVEFTLFQKNNELLHLNEEFRFVTDFVPQIIWSADADGQLDYWNSQWSEYTGLSEEESKKTSWVQRLHSSDTEKTLSAWNKALQSKTPYETECRMRDSNGEYKWFLARARPLKSSDGQLIKWYGSWTQIQDQKMMSEILELKVQERTNELNKSNAQLIRSNNELEQFATVASHDLQEPARKIHIYSNIIKDRCLAGDHSETMLYIDKIISSSARMRRLIVDLLDLSSVSNKAVFENTDLNVVIANVLTDLEWVLKEKKASVIIGELPVIEVMAVQMEQVFLNLIGNAIKFSRPATAP
ncbi:MAG TPA: PAS domain-containing protein, partial [Segetibacter sp.]